MSLLILSILPGVIGCGENIKYVPPQNVVQSFDDPPDLNSMVPDNNDKTGEKGFWMNRPDAEKERNFREGVRATKKTWK